MSVSLIKDTAPQVYRTIHESIRDAIDGEFFTVPPLGADPRASVVAVGVAERAPFGWNGVVVVDGTPVYATTFGRTANGPEMDMTHGEAAAWLAAFLDATTDGGAAVDPHRERLGCWGHEMQATDARA